MTTPSHSLTGSRMAQQLQLASHGMKLPIKSNVTMATSSAQSNQQTNELNASSEAMLARIYAKYEAGNDLLDAHEAKEKRLINETLHSPGLSPVHISRLSSPISTNPRTQLKPHHVSPQPDPSKLTLKYDDALDECGQHQECDHSIHSIRPSQLLDRSSTTINSHSSHRSHPRLTFAESAATDIRVTTSNATVTPGVTRPSDLYPTAADRAHFFQLIQQLWNQQTKMYDQTHHTTNAGQRKPSRSTMTTITSTPSSIGSSSPQSSIASASSASSTPLSFPSQNERSSSHKMMNVTGGEGLSPFTLWESQIISWENRLCQWKNEQERLIAQRVKELERERAQMEQAMKEQEAIYATRQEKYAQSANKLEKQKKEWKEDQKKNRENERVLQEKLGERQKELEKREHRFARQRQEYLDGLQQNSTNHSSSASEETLHKLTIQLTESYELKERELANSYLTKITKLNHDIAQVQQREKLHAKQLESFEADKKQFHEMKERVEKQHQSQEHTHQQLIQQLQTQLQQQSAQLTDIDAKWTKRSESWSLEREQFQHQLQVLQQQNSQSDDANTELMREKTILQGQVDKLQDRIHKLVSQLQQVRTHKTDLQVDLETKDHRLKTFEQQLSAAAQPTDLIQQLKKLSLKDETEKQSMKEKIEELQLKLDQATNNKSTMDQSNSMMAQLQTQLNDKSEMIKSLQNELTLIKNTHVEEQKQWEFLKSNHQFELDRLRVEMSEKEAEWEATLDQQAMGLESIEKREEVVRKQIEWIEAAKHDQLDGLNQREAVAASIQLEYQTKIADLNAAHAEKMAEFETRQTEFVRRSQEQEASWTKRREEYEANMTRYQADVRAFDEAKVAFDESKLRLDQELKRVQVVHDANMAQVRKSQQQIESSATMLQQDRESLEKEKVNIEQMKQEVEQWKSHVAKRDQELTEAIAKFEAHMVSREGSCNEWESRLHVVEEKYGVEFTKMNDETGRLSQWESELLTFQNALLAREKHLNLVEKNLSQYLSPFDDSTVNTSATIEAGTFGTFGTPNKFTLTKEQRKMLQTLATPILQRQFQQQSPINLLTPPSIKHKSSTNSAVVTNSATDSNPPSISFATLTPAYPTGASSTLSQPTSPLVSDHPSPLSLLTDDQEASFIAP